MESIVVTKASTDILITVNCTASETFETWWQWRMAEDTKSQRHAAKGRFTRKLNKLRKSVADDKGVIKQNYDELTWGLEDSHNAGEDAIPALRKVQQALEVSLADCKEANDKYCEFLNRYEALMKVGWILFVQKQYNKVINIIESHIAKVSPKSHDQNIEAKLSNLCLEKSKCPGLMVI